MNALLRKVKSLPNLKRKKPFPIPPMTNNDYISQYLNPPQELLFIDKLLRKIEDVMIIHAEDPRPMNDRDPIWFFQNDIKEEFPMTY